MADPIWTTVFHIPLILALIALARFVYCLPKGLAPSRRRRSKEHNPCRTCVFMGSGGHTGEMLSILKPLPSHYHPLVYILGEDDPLSEVRINEFERNHGLERKVCRSKPPSLFKLGSIK